MSESALKLDPHEWVFHKICIYIILFSLRALLARYVYSASLAQAGVSVIDLQSTQHWGSPQTPVHYAKAELVELGGCGSVLLWESEVKGKKGIDKGR